MTTLGKLLIYVLSLLSVAFFVAAVSINATHVNLRQQVSELQKQVQQANTTIDELKKGIQSKQTELSHEQAARRVALAALQTQLDTDRDRLQQATKQLNDLNSANTQATQNVAQTLAELKRITNENEILKQEIDKIISDRNIQRRSVIKLTDDLNALRSVQTDLEDQVKALQDQATRFQAIAETRGAALNAAGIIDPEDVPPSDLKGIVLAVGSDQSIEVSIGRDDGIREGHLLDIFRGGSYLGRIKIRTVADDKSVGKIVPGYRKGYIQSGDKVAAKIN